MKTLTKLSPFLLIFASLFFLNLNAFSQGSTCTDPLVIPSNFGATYNYSGTTIGFGDDYDSANDCNSTYMLGNDFVFEYNSPGNEILRLRLANLSDSDPGIFILDDCPSSISANCLYTRTSSFEDTVYIETIDFRNAGTYYIVISSDALPQTLDFSLLLDKPIGNICFNAVQIPDFTGTTYNFTGTTALFGDDYSIDNACNSTYMLGNDFVFEYNSPGNEILRLRLANLSDSDPGIFILDDCPSSISANCLYTRTSSFEDTVYIETIDFRNAGTYYIVISSDGLPQTLDFSLLLDKPIGNICFNAVQIPDFTGTTYNFTGTTALFGDDYSVDNACNSTYMLGNDFVFEYNSPGNEILRLRLANLSDSDPGIFILDDCPDDTTANCLYTKTSTLNDTLYIETIDFSNAGTYYIVISSDNSPQNLDFSLLLDRPVGNTCFNAVQIPDFTGTTYNYTGTTALFGNDYGSGSACNSTYMLGNDFVFEYNSPGNEILRLRMANLSNSDPGIFILDDCPDDTTANCLYTKTSTLNDTLYIETIDFGNAGTYYFVISSDNSPNTIDFSMLLDRPIGNICFNAEQIPDLSANTYSYNGTTALFGNDYNSTDACNSVNMLGNDFVFEYTANANEYIDIQLIAQTDADMGLFLIQGCPNDSTSVCIESKSNFNATPLSISTSYCLTEGITYYIVVSSDNTPKSYDFQLNVSCNLCVQITAANETSGNNNDLIICDDEKGITNFDLTASANSVAGNTFAGVWDNPTNSTTTSISEIPTNTTTYTYTITDNVTGCTAKAYETAIINPTITSNYIKQETSGNNNDRRICFDDAGTSNVTLTVNPVGGTVANDYSYSWNNSSSNSNVAIVAPTVTTNYTATITDDVGCDINKSTNIIVLTALTASTSVAETSGNNNDARICFDDAGNTNATVTTNVSGSEVPYNYMWTNNQTSSSITVNPNSTTLYTVLIEDNRGCTLTKNRNVIVMPEINLDITTTENSGNLNDGNICYDEVNTATVQLTAIASGGSSPFDYLWNNNSSNQSITTTAAQATNYDVEITDFRGCIKTTNQNITIGNEITGILNTMEASGNEDDNHLCYTDLGSTPITLEALASGGNGTFNYLWTNGVGVNYFMEYPYQNTVYSFTATDAFGCKITDNYTFTIGNEISGSIQILEESGTYHDGIICQSQAGTIPVNIDAIVSGGNGNFDYLFTNGEDTNAFVDFTTSTTNYEFTATDNFGCTVSDNFTVVVEESTIIWDGVNTGNWNDNTNNWDLNRFPTACDNIVIPANKNVTLRNGFIAEGYSLIVEMGADLIIEPNADFIISAGN